VHTVVKIAPGYRGPVIWVPDASRSVAVCSNLLSDELRDKYITDVRAEYARIKTQHEQKKGPGPMHRLADARKHGLKTDWSAYTPPVPSFLGVKQLKNYDLAEIASCIDWGPFFQTWELAGPYPKILDDEIVGVEARKVLADGKAMLKKIIDGKWLTANAVFGIFPAASVNEGDDIEIYVDEKRSRVLMTWHNLRQQNVKPAGRPNLCLGDFIAPKGSGVRDYIGAFAVTAGIGIEKRVKAFEDRHDDFSAIMLKALADRLAEAFTELLHKRVRMEFWGYAKDENLDNDALIAEKYRGIRPAPGYPSCPDHTEKGALFELLRAPEAGITLTESYAMYPASSVSGFYFSHPEARYFAVGRIERDQVEDYARRKNMPVAAVERWLAPYLAYDSAPAPAASQGQSVVA
jgi:5-methyltetrahydrofolate--homocysteine methyltransferase